MNKKPSRVKAAILDWLGVQISPSDGVFWSEYYGANSNAGVPVDQQKMLTLSAVWACTRLISETIATMPLSLYEKTPTGKKLATDHPLYMVLHDQPNSDTTASVHWESTIAAMLLRGNGRAEKLMSGNKIIGLQFLDPRRLIISCSSTGQTIYTYCESNSKKRVIPANRIFNIPGFSLDGKVGVSAIEYGANVFGAALASNQAANSTFKNGLMPTTYFKMDRVLTPKQREDFRTGLIDLKGSLNAGQSPLLEAGMDVGNVGINPNDAQLLESRGFDVEEVCRWFRVPPFMVGHSEKSTSWGTGVEQQMIGFLTFTLGPWLRRIEQAISKDLLTPIERLRYYPKFAVEGLLRADSAGRSAFYSSMVNNGILTRDEIRELEDREPMGGNAAELTVQSAMTTLDSIGQTEAVPK